MKRKKPDVSELSSFFNGPSGLLNHLSVYRFCILKMGTFDFSGGGGGWGWGVGGLNLLSRCPIVSMNW